MITVALIDDHLIVRSGFAQLLGLEPDLQVVAEFGSGREALAGLPGRGVQVCICDISMPDISGLELLSQLPKGMATIVLSVHDSPALVEQALNWRIACLTVGNEHLFFPFNHRCCLLFYLLRRVVLPVEYQPASGRAPGAGGATLSLRPAPGTYAAMPARILASIAGRGVAAGVLVGAGSCVGPSAAFDDR